MARSNAILLGFAVVNAIGTDGFSIVSLYSCGTQSRAYGWFGSVESAENSIRSSILSTLYDTDLPIHDWTYTIDEN